MRKFVKLTLSHGWRFRTFQHHGLSGSFRIPVKILFPLSLLSFHTSVVLNLSFTLEAGPKVFLWFPRGTQLFEPCFQIGDQAICGRS